MDANFTYPIILNATIIQPSQPNDWLPVFVSIAVVILGGIVTYYVNKRLERNRTENETLRLLRNERKELYKEIFGVISIFKSKYLDDFAYLDMDDPIKDQYRSWIVGAEKELWDMNNRFTTEIELIGNLEIAMKLRENYRILHGFYASWNAYRFRRGHDEEAPQKITKHEVKLIEENLGTIIRMMRTELVPLTEIRSELLHKEFWWE